MRSEAEVRQRITLLRRSRDEMAQSKTPDLDDPGYLERLKWYDLQMALTCIDAKISELKWILGEE